MFQYIYNVFYYSKYIIYELEYSLGYIHLLYYWNYTLYYIIGRCTYYLLKCTL